MCRALQTTQLVNERPRLGSRARGGFHRKMKSWSSRDLTCARNFTTHTRRSSSSGARNEAFVRCSRDPHGPTTPDSRMRNGAGTWEPSRRRRRGAADAPARGPRQCAAPRFRSGRLPRWGLERHAVHRGRAGTSPCARRGPIPCLPGRSRVRVLRKIHRRHSTRRVGLVVPRCRVLHLARNPAGPDRTGDARDASRGTVSADGLLSTASAAVPAAVRHLGLSPNGGLARTRAGAGTSIDPGRRCRVLAPPWCANARQDRRGSREAAGRLDGLLPGPLAAASALRACERPRERIALHARLRRE